MTGFALGVSATAGLWPFLVITGTAFLFLGVIVALSATLPTYLEKEKAARTEGGLILSTGGTTLVLLGTTMELLPRIGWLWRVIVCLLFIGVICVLVTVARRMEWFGRAPSHAKIGGDNKPKTTAQREGGCHDFRYGNEGADDTETDDRDEPREEIVGGQARMSPRESPEPRPR